MMSYQYPPVLPGVKWLLIACGAVFIAQMLPGMGRTVTAYGALVPSLVIAKGEVWRVVTYMFLHGNPVHLLFNMLALWMFSAELEEMWGTRRFVIYYLVGGIGSALFSVIMWNMPVVGASGAIFALLYAYGRFFPDRQILLFFFFPVPARMAAVVFFFVMLLAGGNIAHVTHLGGILVGMAYFRIAPLTEAWARRRAEEAAETDRRSRAERYLSREKYYEDVIDPILKKISEHGMDSLTRREKAVLKKAAHDDPARFKKSRILPFDLFA